MDPIVRYDQISGSIWFDGELVDTNTDQAKTHLLSHGFHYGNLFEGIRSYGGNLLLAPAHIQRMLEGGETFKYENVPYTLDELVVACRQVVKVNGLTNAYLRPIMWTGSEDIHVSDKGNTIHVAIIGFPLEAVASGPQRLMISTYKRWTAECYPVHTKSTGTFVVSRLAKKEAEEKGFDDALMFDTDGNAADCHVANIHFVDDDKIYTPKSDNILAGITQEVCRRIALKLGYQWITCDIKQGDLANYSDGFLCGTAAEVQNVIGVDDTKFDGNGVSAAIIQEYRKLVFKTPAEVDKYLGISGGRFH